MVLRSRGWYDGPQLAWCLAEADSQQNNLIVPNQAYEYYSYLDISLKTTTIILNKSSRIYRIWTMYKIRNSKLVNKSYLWL